MIGVSRLKCNIHARTTKRLAILMFTIKVLAYLHLINIEIAAKVVQWAAHKGWLCQYKVDTGKWNRLKLGMDYTVTEG